MTLISPRTERRPGGRVPTAPRPVPELPSGPTSDAVVTPGQFLLGTVALATVTVGGSTALAYLLTVHGAAVVHDRMLPWILGRSLGLASYLTLTGLVLLGTWLRHPWRNRMWSPRPDSVLRAHVVLAAATVVLLAGHLTSIALDRYAGVGWGGTFLPWQAHYRPTAVALGTLGMYAMVLVGGTAALAGSIARRVWFPIHTVSAGVLCLCLVHGVLAGSDSQTLRWVYVITGAFVALAQTTRWLARRTAGRGSLEFE